MVHIMDSLSHNSLGPDQARVVSGIQGFLNAVGVDYTLTPFPLEVTEVCYTCVH